MSSGKNLNAKSEQGKHFQAFREIQEKSKDDARQELSAEVEDSKEMSKITVGEHNHAAIVDHTISGLIHPTNKPEEKGSSWIGQGNDHTPERIGD